MTRTRPARVALRLVVGALFLFLWLPVFVVVPLSFSSSPYLQFPPPGFSTQWYERFLSDPAWLDAAAMSVRVALATASGVLLVGLPLAIAVERRTLPFASLWDRLAMLPMVVPTIIVAVALYGLFAWLRLVGTWYGVAIGHTVLALPLALVLIRAELQRIDPALELAAKGLGAGRPAALAFILLPLIRPGLIAAAALSFVLSFDELIVALFLSGANATLPRKMFENISSEVDPVVAVVAVLQIAVVMAVLVAIAAMRRRPR